MKKKFGIFEINTKARCYKDGLNQIDFLSERNLWDTEEEAINWIPSNDGHYIVLPVYIINEQEKREIERKKWDDFKSSLSIKNENYKKSDELTKPFKNLSLPKIRKKLF